jgi:hypothetical protein
MVIEKITALVSVEWVMITVRLSFAIRSWCGRIQVRRAMLIRVHYDNTAAPLSGSLAATSFPAFWLFNRNVVFCYAELALTGTGVIPAGLIPAPGFQRRNGSSTRARKFLTRASRYQDS